MNLDYMIKDIFLVISLSLSIFLKNKGHEKYEALLESMHAHSKL